MIFILLVFLFFIFFNNLKAYFICLCSIISNYFFAINILEVISLISIIRFLNMNIESNSQMILNSEIVGGLFGNNIKIMEDRADMSVIPEGL